MKSLYFSLAYLTVFFSRTLADEPSGYFYRPEQVHIALGEDVSSIVVMWSTKNFTESVVHYGDGMNNLSLTAKGSASKFVDGGERKLFQYFHRVILTNLKPDSLYRYHCGSDLAWSDVFQFKTVPEGTGWTPHLAFYGDLGVKNDISLPSLQRDVANGLYDVILHAGDFAYNFHNDNGMRGDQFMNLIEPLAAYVPYMVAVGNHENCYNFSHYKARFSMPGSADNMFYSFHLGPALFIGFSSEVYQTRSDVGCKVDSEDLTPCVVQYRWLEKRLQEANKPENRAKHPWIVTFAHQPMYCGNIDHTLCTQYMSPIRTGLQGNVYCKGLEKLFFDHGVDLQLYAHQHSYERLWPVYDIDVYNGSWDRPYVDPRAPVHVISGNAGNVEKFDLFPPNPPAWSAFRSSDYGYSRLRILNNTHLHMEQVSVNQGYYTEDTMYNGEKAKQYIWQTISDNAEDGGGEVIDHFWLIKNRHGPFRQNEEL